MRSTPRPRLTDLTGSEAEGLLTRGSNDMWEGRKVTDRVVSVGCVAAYALWAVAVVMLVGGLVLGNLHLENVALVLSAGAATATVRSYIVNQNRMMRNAFELGRTAAKGGSVRPIQ